VPVDPARGEPRGPEVRAPVVEASERARVAARAEATEAVPVADPVAAPEVPVVARVDGAVRVWVAAGPTNADPGAGVAISRSWSRPS
jgi:hypothetical protein